ncbi:MAG: hypothetical protein K6V97_04985 [Actinomycetia bacterium]|nr:hypothetical protein [Actinomycetes bacterium]
MASLLTLHYPPPWRAALEAVLALLPALSLALAATVGSEILRLWFGVPWWLGGLLTLGPAVLLAAMGIGVVTATNAIILPFLLAVTVLIALQGGTGTPTAAGTPEWIGSAVVYASYNLFLSLGVTLGAGRSLVNPGDSWKAAGLSMLVTFATAAVLYRALLGTSETAIPLWPAATALGDPWPHLYAGALFAALFGSATAQAYLIVSRHGPWAGLATLLLVLTAPLGLPALVRHGYPLFGILAVPFWLPLLSARGR